MNPPNTPNAYHNNFLPSKKFIAAIGLVALVAGVAFGIWKLVAYLNRTKATVIRADGLVVTVPSGDPTSRDSDGDGIPDWQEIATGLNPLDAETKNGTPDAQAFAELKQKLGIGVFDSAAANATDSDKLALAIYNDLAQNSAASGTATHASVMTVTGTEVENYINSRKAKFKVYSKNDLAGTTANTDADVKNYYAAISKLDPSLFTKTFTEHLTIFAQGKETKDAYMSEKIRQINDQVALLTSIPVPTTAVATHLAVLNDYAGIAQTLDTHDTHSNDELAQFGTIGLAQGYLTDLVSQVANASVYFSITINKTIK